MARLFMSSLKCIDTNELRDEPYLLVEGKKVWEAERVDDGDLFMLHKEIKPIDFTDNVVVELWEDDAKNDDRIGKIRIGKEESAWGLRYYSFRDEDARYDLYYYVLEDNANEPEEFFLQLEKLNCYMTEDLWDGDEIYIVVNSENVWGPNKVFKQDTVDLKSVEPIKFISRAAIRLYDEDPKIDDFLGLGYARASQVDKGSQILHFTQDGAYYILTFSVKKENMLTGLKKYTKTRDLKVHQRRPINRPPF